MKLWCVLVVLSLLGVASAQKKWALLLAGSNTWDNYRHQADICHAYQILHKNGIPDEQIVVMMYDDLANNPANPTPGKVINRPNGPDVYKGVPKDYTGKDVIPSVFFAALQGKKDEVERLTGRSGKVIDSGPDDHIFVYFADHGAAGILAMPDVSPVIHKKDLIRVLKQMYTDKRYAKFVFYVEACESGSMFEDALPDNINMYVTTAANAHESSYAFYWDDKRETYLGDLYSIAWMEDTDNHNVATETFEVQYERVKKRTNLSHVQQYGEMTKGFTEDFLADFFADKKSPNASFSLGEPIYESTTPLSDAIPSEMVPMTILKKRLEKAPANSKLKAELESKFLKLQKTMMNTHELIWNIAKASNSHLSEDQVFDKFVSHHEDIDNLDCYQNAVDTLVELCPGINLNNNDFALRKLYVLVNVCNHQGAGKIISAIEAAVTESPLCKI